LKAGTGAATTVEIQMFVELEDAHFRVPKPGATPYAAAMRQQAQLMGFTYETGQSQSGTFAQVGKSLGKDLDDVIVSTLPAVVKGAIHGVLLDKPAESTIPPPLVRKDAGYMTASRGVEHLERMTLEPSAQYLTSDQFSTTTDETDIAYLTRKPEWLTNINWAATQPIGTLLYSTIVSPSHLISDTPVPSVGVNFTPTSVGLMADHFTYWRGGLKFTFQVCGTPFHEGRLQFVYSPHSLVPPASYEAALSQYVETRTIRNANNTVEVIVPHIADIPWRRTWQGEPLTTVNDPDNGRIRASDYVHGVLSVYVAIPLKSPNNVTSNVDINVFISGADDLEYHMASLDGSRYLDSNVAIERGQQQSGTADLNQSDLTDSAALTLATARAQTSDMPVQHFGESYKNLRELAKRYQTITRINISPLNATTNVNAFNIQLYNVGGIVGRMAHAYRLFRGPYNFKVQILPYTTAGSNRYDMNLTGFISTVSQPITAATGTVASLNDALGFGLRLTDNRTPALVRFSTTQVAEFQVPFQSIYHSLIVTNDQDIQSLYNLNSYHGYVLPFCIPLVGGTPATDVTVTLSGAFADETRLGAFLGWADVVRKTTAPYPNPLTPIFP